MSIIVVPLFKQWRLHRAWVQGVVDGSRGWLMGPGGGWCVQEVVDASRGWLMRPGGGWWVQGVVDGSRGGWWVQGVVDEFRAAVSYMCGKCVNLVQGLLYSLPIYLQDTCPFCWCIKNNVDGHWAEHVYPYISNEDYSICMRFKNNARFNGVCVSCAFP